MICCTADIIIVSVNIYLFSRFQKVTTLRIISYTMLIRQIIWRHTFQAFKGTFVMIHLITFRNNEVLTLTTCPLTSFCFILHTCKSERTIIIQIVFLVHKYIQFLIDYILCVLCWYVLLYMCTYSPDRLFTSSLSIKQYHQKNSLNFNLNNPRNIFRKMSECLRTYGPQIIRVP